MHAFRIPAVWALAACMAGFATGCEGRTHQAGSVQIERPAAVVFPYLTDPSKRKLWVGGVLEIKEVTRGSPRLGARADETLDMGGQSALVHSEVTEFVPGKLVSVRGVSDKFDLRLRYELVSLGAKTRLDWTADFAFKQPVAALLIVPIGADIKQKFELDAKRLKRIVEERK